MLKTFLHGCFLRFLNYANDIKASKGSHWTPSGSCKGPMKQDLSVIPSGLLSGCHLGILSLVFSEFWHNARNPYEVVRDSRIFWGKIVCPKIWENRQKLAQKTVFFEFIERFGH